MYTFRKSVLAILALTAISSTSLFADATVGKPAPDFTLPATDGQTYHLSDFKGKFVVLEWYNPECPFVKKHYGSGNMQKLQGDYLHKGVIWLSINSAAVGKEGYLTKDQAIKDRIDRKSRSTATLLDPDGKVGQSYGAKTTPHMFVIDAKGNVVYAGAIDSKNSADPADIAQSKNYVAAALDEAMTGKPVATPSTPPYGCSVKYKK
jgi:peroxiredoxin